MRRAEPEQVLALVRRVLAGREAWLVGGLVRDLASDAGMAHVGDSAVVQQGTGTESALDLDLVARDDPELIARELARAGLAASFPLSDELGAWRVVARDGSWQIDVEPLRGETLEGDLRQRDFTINAIAQSLDGGQTFDPLGGLQDLAERRLRAPSDAAFREDPLRVLRLVRLAVNLELRPEEGDARARARLGERIALGLAGARSSASSSRSSAAVTPSARCD